MSAPRHRSRLFATSAIGAIALAALWAVPAHAQLVQGATPAQSNGGAPVINQAGGNTTVALNGSRTVIDWDRFDINGGETADFVFANRSDIVLNRVGGAASTINGNLNGMIGAGGPAGGNIWIYNANGVVIGANARISTGGLLVTTAALDRATDSSAGGFLDGSSTSFNFSGAAASKKIEVQNGAQVDSYGGSVALVAQTVNTATGSAITAHDGGNVLYGALANYKISFAPTGNDDFDLISFEVAGQADGAASGQGITLNGATSGNRVYAAVVSKTGLSASVTASGTISATNAVAGEDGTIILSAGHNIVNGTLDAAAVSGAGFGAAINTGTLDAPSVGMAATWDVLTYGTVNAGTGTLDLRSDGHDVTSAGAITAGTLTAWAVNNVEVGTSGTTSISKLGNIAAGGELRFRNSANIPLEIAGAISSGGQTIFTSRGAVSGSGAFSTSQLYLDLQGGGTLNVDGSTTLTQLGMAGNTTIHADDSLTLGGIVAGNGFALTLTADNGNIAQTGGNISSVSTLTATAGGDIDLQSQFNDIANFIGKSTGDGFIKLRAFLPNFSADTGGDVVIHATLGDATATGTLRAGTLDVTSEGGAISIASADSVGSYVNLLAANGNISVANAATINLAGNVTAGGTLNLQSLNGSIVQSAGTIGVTGNYALSAQGGISLDQAGNHLGDGINVASITGAGGDLLLRTDGKLNLDFHGSFDDVGLTAGGEIAQFTGMTANSLTAQSSYISLGALNQVGTVHDLLGGANVSFRNDGSFTIDGAVSSTNGVALVANSGSITQVAGSVISSDMLYLEAAGAIDQDAAARAAASTAFEAHAGTNLILAGANDLGYNDAYLTAGSGANVTIRSVGDFRYNSYAGTVGTLTLISDAGGIRQGSGITATTLIARAATGLQLDGGGVGNAVATVGELTATSGDITFSEGNGFDIAGNVSAATGAVSFGTNGTITTSAGKIDADTLTVTAGGGAVLRAAGDIKLGDVYTNSGGDFSLTADGGIDATGYVNAGTSYVTLGSGGAITRHGGTFSAGMITTNAVGGIDIDNVGAALIWATSSGGGDINLSGNSDVFVKTDTAGDLTIDAGGYAGNNDSVIARSVGINAANGIYLFDQNGTVGSYRYLTSSGGAIDIENKGDINIDGNVTANAPGNYIRLNSTQGSLLQNSGTISGYSVELDAVQAVTQDASARIVTGDGGLGFKGLDVTLAGANEFPWLSGYTVIRDLTLRAAGNLDMSGSSNQAGSNRNVTLISDTGNIQGGYVDADKLTATATNGKLVFNYGNNQIRSLGALTAKSTAGTDIDIFTDTLLGLTDNITGGGVKIYATQGIDQTAGAITADRLYTGTGGNLLLGGANDFGALLDFGHGNGTNVTIRNRGSIALPSTPNTFGTLTLTSDTGSISQTNAITAATLDVRAATGIDLSNTSNNFTTLTALSTNTGNIAIGDVGGFMIEGDISAATGAVALTSTGIIDTGRTIVGPDTIPHGKVDADTITVSGFRANLWAKDDIKLGNVNVTNGFTVIADHDLDLTGTINAAASLIATTGSITQSGGSWNTSLFATTAAAGDITLLRGNNLTSFYGQSSGGGTISLNNSGSGPIDVGLSTTGNAILIVTGNLSTSGISADRLSVSAGDINLTNNVDVNGFTGLAAAYGDILVTNNGSFAIEGDVTTNKPGLRTTDLRANGGGISQTAGTISGHYVSLRGAGDLIQSGTARIDSNAAYFNGVDVLLGGANSLVSNDTDIVATGDLTLRNAGSIDLDALGGYTSGGVLSLTSDNGSITSGNAVTASALTALAANGAVSFTSADNLISEIRGLSAGTNATVRSRNGGFTLTGEIDVGGTLSLHAGTGISQTGGRIKATTLDAQLYQTMTTGSVLLGGANDVDYLYVLAGSGGGDVLFRDTDGFRVTYAVIGNRVTLTADTGAITQSSGIMDGIQANELTASAVDGISLNNEWNSVHTILGLTNTGTGGINLVSRGGNMILGGNVAAAGQTVSLTAQNGSLSQSSGAITAGRLDAAARTGITLTQAGNNIAQLGTLTNSLSGGIAYTDADGYGIAGNISAAGQSLTLGSLDASANIEQALTGSLITAGMLNISGGRYYALRGLGAGGNAIDAIGNVNAKLHLIASGAVDFRGDVVTDYLELISSGDITQSGGHIENISDGQILLRGANISLTRTTNRLGNLLEARTWDGGPDFGTGDVTLVSAGDVAVGFINAVNASLTTTGNVGSMDPVFGGTVNAERLSVSAGGTISLGGAIKALADVTGRDEVFITSSTDMALTGVINAGTGALALHSTGLLSQTAGSITAGLLSAQAGTGIDLGRTNFIFGLTGLSTTSGDITYRNRSNIMLPDVSAPGTLTLVSETGSITQGAGTSVTAGTLAATAADAIDLTGTNHIANLGALNAGNAISVSTQDSLTLIGDISAASVALTSSTGAISQAGGIVTTPTLTLRAGSDITLDRANAVGVFNAWAGIGGTLTLRNAGNLVVNAITAQNGTVNLTSNTGSVSQLLVPGNSIWTRKLNVNAATDIDLAAQNFTELLGNLNAGGSIRYDSFQTLGLEGDIRAGGGVTFGISGYLGQYSGTINADHLDVTASGIALIGANDIGSTAVSTFSASDDITFRSVNSILLGAVSTPGLLSLTSDGGHIRQIAAFSAGRLDAMAAGDIVLDQLNTVNTLYDVTAGGVFTLRGTGALTLDGQIVARDRVTLDVGDDLTQIGNYHIVTDRLEATTGAGATNGIRLLNHNRANQVSFNANGKDVRFRNQGSIAINAISSAGHTIELISDTGSVTQDGVTGALLGSLIVKAAGAVTLQAANNQIEHVDVTSGGNVGISTGGSGWGGIMTVDRIDAAGHQVSLSNSVAAINGGNITADSLYFFALGADLTTANNVRMLSGHTSNLDLAFTNTGDLLIDQIVSPGADVSLRSEQGAITQTAFGLISLGGLTAYGRDGVTLGGYVERIDGLAAGPGADVSLWSEHALDIAGDITARHVELLSNAPAGPFNPTGGMITQSGGVITADRLIARALGEVTLDGSNAIAGLGWTVSTTGNVHVKTGGALDLGDLVQASNGTVTLAADSLSQSGGYIETGSLNAAAVGAVSLGMANLVSSSGTVSLSGSDIEFRNDGSFRLGTITQSGTTGGIDLTSINGSITQVNGGGIAGAFLTAQAHDALTLDQANDVARLGDLTAQLGAVTYNGIHDYELTGDVGAGTGVTLTGAGGIQQTAGAITADTLNLAAGSANLGLSNDVDKLGTIATSGNFAFRNVGDIEIQGGINAANLSLYSNSGDITQPGNAINANAITLVAGGSVDVQNATFNYIGSLVASTGDITLRTSSDILGANLIYAEHGTVDLTMGRITADAVVANLLNVDATGDVEMTGSNTIAHLGDISGVNVSLGVGETDIAGHLNAGNSIAFVRSSLASDFALTTAGSGAITAPMISLSNTGAAGTATLGNVTAPPGTLELNLNFNGNASVTAGSSAISLNNATVDGDLSLRAGNAIANTGAATNISGTLNASNLADNISLLFGGDIVGHFGDTLSATGNVSIGAASVDITGNIRAGGGAVDIHSAFGNISQFGAMGIDATTVSGSAAHGGFMLAGGGNNFTSVGAITADGDITLRSTNGFTIGGSLTSGGWISLLSGGGITLDSGGYTLSTGRLSIIAAGAVDLTGGTNHIANLGSVTANSLALVNQGDLVLDGNLLVDTVDLQTTGRMTQSSSGHIAADTLAISAGHGFALDRQNHVGTLSIAAGATADSISFTNAQDLALSGDLTSADDITLDIAGMLTATNSTIGGANVSLTTRGLDLHALSGSGTVWVDAGAGAVTLGGAAAGDDLSLTTTGNLTLGAIAMGGLADANGDGFNVLLSGHDVVLGDAMAASPTNTLTYLASVTPGTVTLAAAGDATVRLDAMNAAIDISAAGGDVYAQSNGQLLLGDTSGANVTLAAGADLQANSVTVPGAYSITAADFGAGAFNILGNPFDIAITDTLGDLNLSGSIAAGRNLTVTAQAGDVLGATARLGAGLSADGKLGVNGTNIVLLEASSLYDVELNAAGTIDARIVSVGRNYRLAGTSILDGALASIGAQTGVLDLRSAGDLDLNGGQLVYAGGITFDVQGLLRNGSLRSTGSWVSGLADALDLDEIRASAQIDSLARNGEFRVFHMASDMGSVSVRGASVSVLGSVEAANDIRLVGVNGDARAGYATAGRNIEVRATNGDAVLRQANLAGAFGGLTLRADNGSAILGDDDASGGIGTDRWFEGAAGSASITGDLGAYVNLDHSAVIASVSGADVAVNIANGDLTIGQLTAGTQGGRVLVENGSLTIGGASVTGGVLDLQADGDLIAQGALGGLDTYLAAGALLDTRAAPITGINYLELTGGEIRAGALASGGDIHALGTAGAISADSVHSTGGDAIFSASGDLNLGSLVANGGQLQAGGNATLRAITAPGGFALVALGGVTLGADTADLITGGNTLVTGGSLGGCACGTGGATVIALGGDARVNLRSATGVFDTIASAIDGDALVHVSTGDLAINELAGHGIAVTLPGGTLTVMTPVSSGGDYALTARDFAANALDPTFGGTATALDNVTIIDLLGDLGAGGTLTAAGDIHVEAQGGGLTGTLRLLAGGDVSVTGQGIRLGDVAGRDVALDAGNATIDLAGTATVGRDYMLTGGSFSVAALTPAGARAGTMSVNADAGSDFNLAGAHLQYNGNVFIHSLGAIRNGDISAGGGIQLISQGVDLGALDAGTQLGVEAGNGDVAIASARAGDSIHIHTVTGDIGLGAASFTGTAGNLLSLTADTGAVRLGAADATSITAGNVFTGAGSSVRAILNTGEDLVVNLASAGELYDLRGRNVRIAVQNGDLAIDTIEAGRLDLAADGNVDLGNGGTSRIDTLGTITVINGDFSIANRTSLDIAGILDVRNGVVDLRLTDPGSNLTQSSGVILAQLLIGSVAGMATLGGDNEVGTLGAFATRGLVFNNRTALAIGGLVEGSTGAVTIRSHGGMTIDAAGSVQSGASGDAIVLASDGAFRNLAGADALDAQSGRWLVYSQAAGNAGASDPANDFGGLAGRSYYGSAYDFGTGSFAAAPNPGNRFVYGYRSVLTVTPDDLRVTYQGAIPALTATITGLVNGDSAADAWSGAASLSGAGRNAGSYTVDATLGSLASDMNYAFAFGTGTVVIDPRVITAALVADDRTYNGNTDATGHIVLTGLLGADQVSAIGDYAFDSRNAGTRTVTATSIALSGADAGNYVVNATATDFADILARIVTATLTANDRIYDGTTDATGALALSGILAGDDVGLVSGGMAFDSRNAGAHTVTASGMALTGADAGNYVVNATATDMADILARAITVTLTANDRTYDGTTNATGTVALTGILGADQVSASGSYAFDSRNAGTGRTVTASGITLSGADAGNYTVNATATDLADILARAITATLTADDRIYDGTTGANGALALGGVIAGDTVGVTSGGMAFGSRNAGARTATATGIALTGADAGNYVVNATATDMAEILARAITVTLTANDKIYDGTTGATGALSLGGLVAGDQVGVTGSIAFDSRNAGERIATVGGLALTGADAGNYVVGGSATDIATILRRAITGAAIADSRIYDGTLVATGRITLNGVLTGDLVSAAAAYAFADANAGTNRIVSVNGLTINGADAGNYFVTLNPNPVIADILRRPVAVMADDLVKLFGQPDPAFTWRVTGGSLVGGDAFTGALTRAPGEQAGTYAISQGSLALSANYLLTVTPGSLVVRFTQSGADASDALKELRPYRGFATNDDPSANLEGDEGEE